MEHLETRVESHYTTEGLMGRIDAALGELGVSGTDPGDLKPVDEFHTGGLEATEALLSQLTITPQMRVLDIGAGLGGTARHVRTRYGAEVTGVDLTQVFVDVAKVLNARAGLDGGIHMMQGSALDMPVAGGSTDLALMLHVGMNIEDKPRLMAEVARVLKPGGVFALFDVMQDKGGAPEFPLPWSEEPGTSFVEHPLAYRSAAEGAGLTHVAQRDRRDFTLTFFARVMAAMKAAGGPPPLGIHLLMRETAGRKIANYVANVEARRFIPVEMIFRKGGG